MFHLYVAVRWDRTCAFSLLLLYQNKHQNEAAAATTRGYLGAAGLIVCYALSAVLDTQFNLRLARLQLHIRASLVAAVYR